MRAIRRRARAEEILLYPGVWALGFHRLAHWLYEAELYFLARWSTTSRAGSPASTSTRARRSAALSSSTTASPVIGETAEIGDNVTIYQCVTLGGTNRPTASAASAIPTLSDNVIIGSGAQIIGPIVIGERARVGANAVVTDDVPEGATMVGLKARSTLVPAETWLKEFIPYGTPCDEPCEPSAERVQLLEHELAMLRAEVEALKEGSARRSRGRAAARKRSAKR
jgi:serine O-acetyltransferase